MNFEVSYTVALGEAALEHRADGSAQALSHLATLVQQHRRQLLRPKSQRHLVLLRSTRPPAAHSHQVGTPAAQHLAAGMSSTCVLITGYAAIAAAWGADRMGWAMQHDVRCQKGGAGPADLQLAKAQLVGLRVPVRQLAKAGVKNLTGR